MRRESRGGGMSGEDLMAWGFQGMAFCLILVMVLAFVIAVLAITGRYNLFTDLAKEDARRMEKAAIRIRSQSGRQ